MEKEASQWLKSLGFVYLFIQKNKPLFDDPLRNGTLLCKLLNKLEMAKINYFVEHPKNIDECKYNIEIAFKNLKNKNL